MESSLKDRKEISVLIVNTGDGDNRENIDNLVYVLEDPYFTSRYHITYEIVGYKEVERDLSSKYNLILISGRPKKDSPSTLKEIKEYYSWLRDYKGAFLAICGGYQRWLQVLGGKLEKVEDLEKDITKVSFISGYRKYSNTYVYSKHRYFISINNVPRILDIMGITKGVACVKHKKLPQYGFQGHPEKALRPWFEIFTTDIRYIPTRILYLPIHVWRVLKARNFAINFFKDLFEESIAT